MPSDYGGGARTAVVAAEVVEDGFPEAVGRYGVVTSYFLDFCVKCVEVHCKRRHFFEYKKSFERDFHKLTFFVT